VATRLPGRHLFFFRIPIPFLVWCERVKGGKKKKKRSAGGRRGKRNRFPPFLLFLLRYSRTKYHPWKKKKKGKKEISSWRRGGRGRARQLSYLPLFHLFRHMPQGREIPRGEGPPCFSSLLFFPFQRAGRKGKRKGKGGGVALHRRGKKGEHPFSLLSRRVAAEKKKGVSRRGGGVNASLGGSAYRWGKKKSRGGGTDKVHSIFFAFFLPRLRAKKRKESRETEGRGAPPLQSPSLYQKESVEGKEKPSMEGENPLAAERRGKRKKGKKKKILKKEPPSYLSSMRPWEYYRREKEKERRGS